MDDSSRQHNVTHKHQGIDGTRTIITQASTSQVTESSHISRQEQEGIDEAKQEVRWCRLM